MFKTPVLSDTKLGFLDGLTPVPKGAGVFTMLKRVRRIYLSSLSS